MEHCNADEATLRQHLEAAIDHFQMRHDRCNASSVCRQPGYVPEFIVVTDPVAVQLQYTGSHPTIFGRDTCLVESFNNVMLLYINKRVHYRNETYELRRNLAVLDWNEHVSRAYTSVWSTWADGYEKRGREKKRYKQKTLAFVEQIWQALQSALSGSVSEDTQDNVDSDSETESDGTIAYSLPSSDADSSDGEAEAASCDDVDRS